MKSFEVEGVSYRSISEFCRKRKVSYWKMVRLCRKYVRAKKDPAVAAKWILGIEKIQWNNEPVNFMFSRYNELSKLRVLKSKYNRRKILVDSVLTKS